MLDKFTLFLFQVKDLLIKEFLLLEKCCRIVSNQAYHIKNSLKFLLSLVLTVTIVTFDVYLAILFILIIFLNIFVK